MTNRNLAILALLSAATLCSVARAQSTQPTPLRAAIDMPMLTDPAIIDATPVVVVHPRQFDVWLEALARPEPDLQRNAADAFAHAARRGIAGIGDKASPALRKTLSTAKDPLVIHACIRALAALDDRTASDLMLQHASSTSVDTVLTIDAALAHWQHAPARAVWLKRATDIRASRQVRISAFNALAQQRDASAAAPARSVLHAPQDALAVRLAAAQALAAATADTVDDAQKLLRDERSPLHAQLLAVYALQSARGTAAEALLLTLGRTGDPAVQAMAIDRLTNLSPAATAPLTKTAATHRDTTVRRAAARALAAQKTGDAVAALIALLGDIDPTVRALSKSALIAADADTTLRPLVRDSLLTTLEATSPNAQQEAALVLGKLQERRAAAALLNMLTHNDRDSRIAAAVALRWLGEPAHAAPLLAHAQKLAADIRAGNVRQQRAAANVELSQLIQSLGSLGHAPASPLLLELLPKDAPFDAAPRQAACWAIGKIPPEHITPAAIAALSSRAGDNDIRNPESDDVRTTATIALARTKAPTVLPLLRKLAADELTPRSVQVTVRWGIHHLTGTWPAPLPPRETQPTDLFLEPR